MIKKPNRRRKKKEKSSSRRARFLCLGCDARTCSNRKRKKMIFGWRRRSKSLCWNIQSNKRIQNIRLPEGMCFADDEVLLCRECNFNASTKTLSPRSSRLAFGFLSPTQKPGRMKENSSAKTAKDDIVWLPEVAAELNWMIVRFTPPSRLHEQTPDSAGRGKLIAEGARRWNLKRYLIRNELLSYFTLVTL